MRQSVILSASAEKKKKGKSPRQKFYSALMTKLAGDFGNNLAENFVAGNVQDFEKGMAELRRELVRKCSVNGEGEGAK